MNRVVSACVALLMGAVLLLSLSSPLLAQEKKEADQRLSGRVHMINKDTSTITIRTTQNAHRYVVYDSNTKFTLGNKAGSLDEVKEGVRLICLGKFDDKARLMASRIEVRPGR